MSKRRLFSSDITESDAFADMPLSAQALYFHLGMNADDDGFVNNAKKVQRGIGASNDDYNLLIAKRFLIQFETGVVVIKHWHINNSIRKDRKKPTNYREELSMLYLDERGNYHLCASSAIMEDDNQTATKCQPNDRVIQYNTIQSNRKDILSGKPDDSALIKEIVSFLNERIGANYRSSSKKTASLINARLKEGFTLDDFKAVIDKKASDWLGDSKMGRYLRPETLFGTKFEGYLQEAKAVRRDDERFAKYA